jgi:hypothetical protein
LLSTAASVGCALLADVTDELDTWEELVWGDTSLTTVL